MLPLENSLWYFKSALSPKFCDDVIKHALSKPEEMANRMAGWNFQWDYSETVQFTKYKLNQYYDWHMDTFKPTKDNRQRKISMTCQLSDASDYEGGELQFDKRDYNPNLRDESKNVINVDEILAKGSVVVFPSFLWHRVKPVTKGTRYSLVMWNLGDAFR